MAHRRKGSHAFVRKLTFTEDVARHHHPRGDSTTKIDFSEHVGPQSLRRPDPSAEDSAEWVDTGEEGPSVRVVLSFIQKVRLVMIAIFTWIDTTSDALVVLTFLPEGPNQEFWWGIFVLIFLLLPAIVMFLNELVHNAKRAFLLFPVNVLQIRLFYEAAVAFFTSTGLRQEFSTFKLLEAALESAPQALLQLYILLNLALDDETEGVTVQEIQVTTVSVIFSITSIAFTLNGERGPVGRIWVPLCVRPIYLIHLLVDVLLRVVAYSVFAATFRYVVFPVGLLSLIIWIRVSFRDEPPETLGEVVSVVFFGFLMLILPYRESVADFRIDCGFCKKDSDRTVLFIRMWKQFENIVLYGSVILSRLLLPELATKPGLIAFFLYWVAAVGVPVLEVLYWLTYFVCVPFIVHAAVDDEQDDLHTPRDRVLGSRDDDAEILGDAEEFLELAG